MIGIIGTKVGMTRLYDDDGNVVPVTVIKQASAKILEIKSADKVGYNAVKVGYGRLAKKRRNRAIEGYLKKTGDDIVSELKEFRVEQDHKLEVGKVIDLSILDEAQFVDVTGFSKGKGFQGTMKRHGFSGGPGGHGSHFHRAPGSIGNCSYPARVFKGKKMAGRMGGSRETVQNLKLVKIDKEKGILLVKGSIPGKTTGEVIVRESVKKRNQQA